MGRAAEEDGHRGKTHSQAGRFATQETTAGRDGTRAWSAERGETAAPSTGRSDEATNLGERLAVLRALPADLLRGRLLYAARRPYFTSPLHGWLLGSGGAPTFAPLATPPDPWPGNAVQGAAIAAGSWRLVGRTLDNPRPLWRAAGAGTLWLAELHSFSWLRDLRAMGGDGARRAARELTGDWLGRHDTWDGLSWEPLTTARRLSHWLGQYDFFAASAEAMFRQTLLRSAGRQMRYLQATLPAGLVGADLLLSIKGLVIAGACLPRGEGALARGLALLAEELPRQILADGGQVERSPARLLAVLRDLIDMKSTLRAAGREVPEDLRTAIESMAPMLRLFQHGDGGLALFNGSSEEDGLKIDMVLQRADGKGRPRLTAPQSGFQRLQAGRTLLLADAGRPPPPGLDAQAHAGTLSFEVSIGRERLIVNCGSALSIGAGEEWTRALRATAAHSTLGIEDANSSPLSPYAPWGRRGLRQRPVSVHSRREEADGNLLLDLSHDGYQADFGLLHRRRLYLAQSGDDLRGEDSLTAIAGEKINQGPKSGAFAIRFHLHPDVAAGLLQDGSSALLRLPKGGVWRLRSAGAQMTLEDSIYLGGPELRRCQQVVLHGRFGGEPAEVRWSLRRENPQRR
ncbi:MAG: heparinase II/III family protein [Desulfobacterales bacterium]|nr:heparinase II/III family protein [Desulfobacterales bacterium]